MLNQAREITLWVFPKQQQQRKARMNKEVIESNKSTHSGAKILVLKHH